MSTQIAIGRSVRSFRERAAITQQQLAELSKLSYQYISGIENGKENVTVSVLESLALSLGTTLPGLVADAFYGIGSPNPPPVVNPTYFRDDVPMPPGLTRDALSAALNETQRLVHLISANLSAAGGQPLNEYIQSNNFSGIVSNVLSDSLNRVSAYRHHSPQAYPDLTHTDGEKYIGGLEVKVTSQIGKGGESHNGHAGWHLIACFRTVQATGDIEFIHIMLADLVAYSAGDSNADWSYLGSKRNEETGSQRTETYATTLRGTTKLRDGSVYLDTRYINFARWKQSRAGVPPTYSIFYRPSA